MKKEQIPLVFDIQRCSTVDGPGARTTVFFKGCNLDCFWCHNPEGKKSNAQMAFFADRCIGCGLCKRVCNADADGCVLCGKCAEMCQSGARRLFGRKMDEEELLSVIRQDKLFYDATGGGVTFSGGECMLYPDFLAKLMKSCKYEGISTAVDTAGCVPFESFERVLPYTDLFLYDVKCIDRELHKKGTGVYNDLILENLDRLIQTGKDIIIRVPMIPGFNKSEEEMASIRSYIEKRGLTAEYLEYHEMGENKKKALI